MKLDFLRHIFVKKILNFMKIHQVGAELFRADRQTHDEADTRFSWFSERALINTALSKEPVWLGRYSN